MIMESRIDRAHSARYGSWAAARWPREPRWPCGRRTLRALALLPAYEWARIL